MKTSFLVGLAALSASVALSPAFAGTVVIEQLGGGITLRSGDLSATVFGAGQPGWSNTSLASVHAALNADGIITDNKVTTLLADTDHGLALLILIDHETNPTQQSPDAAIHMASFGHGQNMAYINNIASSVMITPNSISSRLAVADFNWDSHAAGDGFGWANLVEGNALSFHFDKIAGTTLGLDDPNTFQFVTYNGNSWELVPITPQQGSFTDAGQFGYGARVIPLPGAAAMAGVSLAGVGLIRRRR
ncbi:MAG TPA: hypothetical protein VD997_04455 [Phycisphaerales bacterium]|nr:hypothetical protein [Phycisphaerales bacterium]